MAGSNGFALEVSRIRTGDRSIAAAAPKMLAFLAEVTDSALLAECKAQAAAVAAYLAQKKDVAAEEHNAALKIKLRVGHRLGEVLADNVRAGRRWESNSDTVSELDRDLPEEITEKQSSRVQQLARVPWQEIAERIDAATKENERASGAKVVREFLREVRSRDLAAKAAAAARTGEGQAWNIHTVDVLEGLRAAVVQPRLVFADPPYNIGVDYGRGVNADRLPREVYLARCQAWMRDVRPLVRDDGSFWVLINDESAAEFNLALRAAGWHIRQWLIWYETFGVNHSSGFNRTHRHLFWAVKNSRRFVFNPDAVNRLSDRQEKYADRRADPSGKTWDSVWGVNPPIPRLVENARERLSGFPTQLPLALLLPIVGCASEPGDLILDLFTGSGTTGEAALRQGRRFLGFESDETIAEQARVRLRAFQGELS